MAQLTTGATPSSSRLIWWLTHPTAFLWRLAGKMYRFFRPQEPWLSRQAIHFLNQALSPSMKGLEWGSGRSTLWFARRLGRLTSVEQHESWFSHVSQILKENRVENVDYRLITLDHPVDEPTPAHYEKVPRYVAISKEFMDESLDFILVDGHYRQACVLASLPKLVPGGFLAIDNSNWMPTEEWGVPTSWPIVHQSMGFDSETTVWQKPN